MLEGILSTIDTEIAKLRQARALLAGVSVASAEPDAPRRGRPKGSKNAAKVAPVKAKRTMSAEGKARIAAAQKKRWAAKKRSEKAAA